MTIHKIGQNSTFDGDMDLAESFVKFYYFNDPSLLLELKSYYKSRALLYWRILKEHLTSTEILQENANEEPENIIESIILERNKERENIYSTNIHSLYPYFYDLHNKTGKGIETLIQERFPLPENFLTATEQYNIKRRISQHELNTFLIPQMKQKIILKNFENHQNKFIQLLDDLENSSYE